MQFYEVRICLQCLLQPCWNSSSLVPQVHAARCHFLSKDSHTPRTQWCLPQVATYAVATGTICLAVFRGLSGMPFGAIWTFSESVAELDYRHVLLGESCHPANPAARRPCQRRTTCGLKSSDFHCKSAGSHPALLSGRVQPWMNAQPDADMLAASCRARHGCGGRGTWADFHAHS